MFCHLQEVKQIAGDVAKRAQRSRLAAGDSARNLSLAETSIERSREALKSSQRYLETEGADALQRAIQRSEKFGQQSERMSQIARDARQSTDQLEETLSLIESTAQEALNTSTSAYLLARDAVDQQKNTTDEISSLQREMGATEDGLSRTKALAKEALKNAQSAYSEALSLLGDAYSLVVPNVEWQFMKRQATQHTEESRRIKDEAEKLLADHSKLLDDTTEQIMMAEALLSRGEQQQQITDGLLADADAALAKSNEAVNLGDKTLQEAQKTLETLQGFSFLFRWTCSKMLNEFCFFSRF